VNDGASAMPALRGRKSKLAEVRSLIRELQPDPKLEAGSSSLPALPTHWMNGGQSGKEEATSPTGRPEDTPCSSSCDSAT